MNDIGRVFKLENIEDIYRYLTDNFGAHIQLDPGIAHDELKCFLEYWPYPLPEEVIQWFMLTRGGVIGRVMYELIEKDNSNTSDLDETSYHPYRAMESHNWREKGYLSISNDMGGGFCVVLTKPGDMYGKVALIEDGELDGPSIVLASCFRKYLQFLINDEMNSNVERCDAKDMWPFSIRFNMGHDCRIYDSVPAELIPRMNECAQQVDSAEASTIAVPPSKPSGSPR